MNVLIILAILVWLYVLSVFYRGKMGFFYFLFGSIGAFIFLMILFRPIFMPILVHLVTSVSGMLGKVTGLYESYRDYSILFIESPKDGSALSLYIDFECSGIIEMLVFVSLLMFFQVYGIWQRIVIGVVGCVVIFFSNVTRIFIICTMIRIWGIDVYYLAHTLIGRIVFYIFAVLLYYFVFTKAQIVRQKVGGFSYAQSNKNTDK